MMPDNRNPAKNSHKLCLDIRPYNADLSEVNGLMFDCMMKIFEVNNSIR